MVSVKVAEQHRLDWLLKKIKVAEVKTLQTIKRDEQNERVLQRDFYNDVRLRSTTYTGLMTTSVEVRQKQQILDQLHGEWERSQKYLKRLRYLEKNPYFARIDFVTRKNSRHVTIYIGLASFSDHGRYLIYDWRAPISSIYYENRLGWVKYQTPSGVRQVKVILKRQFQIKNGRIRTVFDTSKAIGDQLLLSNLSRQSTPKMRNIVTTIQRDQNRIVRDTQADLLYVQGAAGSGKTSAALQRVAYLLYHYRPQLKSNQIILFSPNQLFSDYVNHVLPSLGEHNMLRMTYYQYSNHRANEFAVETLSQRFANDNLQVQRKLNYLKGSLTFYRAVNQYLRDLNHHGMHFKNLMFNRRVFVSKAKIKQIYYSFNSNYDLNNRLSATRERLLLILHRRIRVEMKQKWVSDAIEDMTRDQLRYLQLSHPNDFQDIDQSYDFLAKYIVIGAFRRIKQQITRNRFININRQYIHLLKRLPHYLNLVRFGISSSVWAQSINTVIHDMDYRSISLADVSVYLYLYDRLTGSLGHREIKYIFVDEAQDYTAFQFAFLRYEFPRARFTVLGDLNQAIFTHQTSRSLLSDLKRIFKGRRIHVADLNKAYRSTQQITDFTKYLLPGKPPIKSFARSGKKPQISVRHNHSQELTKLVKILVSVRGRYRSVAVICKSLRTGRLLSRQLKARHVANTLIQSESQRLVPGILVLPVYLAKGLEFDAVIMWDASAKNYANSRDYQLVYTICTRAMHRLNVVSMGNLSPLFGSVPRRLYNVNP